MGKLTRKQKAFADEIIKNPKISGSEAARRTYGKDDKAISPATAGRIAHDNLKNTAVQIYMEKHVDRAKEKMVSLMDSENEAIQYKAAKDLLDRTHGTPKQQIEKRQVNINIETVLE